MHNIDRLFFFAAIPISDEEKDLNDVLLSQRSKKVKLDAQVAPRVVATVGGVVDIPSHERLGFGAPPTNRCAFMEEGMSKRVRAKRSWTC